MRPVAILHGLGATVLAGACLGYGLKHVWKFTIDDAGIVYAYAKHLAEGLGPRAVVGGPVVEGYSDFLWVAILAVVAKAGFALPAAAKTLGAVLLALTCLAAARLIAQARPASSGLAWAAAVPAVLLGLCPEFVVWAPSGLENGLFWALLLGMHWLDGEEASRPARFPFSALAALGLCLTRPEGVVYAGITLVAKLAHAALSPSHRRHFVRALAVFAVPFALYQAGHYAVFRELVPNTYFAKAPGHGAWEKGRKYVHEGLRDNFVYASFPLAAVGLASGARRSLPLLASATAALAFAVYSRGDWMPHHRFVSLALPPIATLAGMGVSVLSRAFARASGRAWVSGLVALPLTLGLAARWRAAQLPRFSVATLKWCHLCDRLADAEEHRKFLSGAGVPAGTFLTNDFGGPSFTSSKSFYPLDLLGLCDAGFAQLEYRRRKGDFPEYEVHRLLRAFHEQEAYPTLLFFGANFWRSLGSTPESLWGYVDAQPPRVVRTDFIPTKLHRGAFVDFFPRVDSFVFTPLDDRFTLVGASAYVRPGAKGEIQVELSLNAVPSSERATFLLVTGGIQGKPVTLFGRQPSLGASFRSGEPLAVSLDVRPKAGAAPEDIIELGIRRGDGPWSSRPLFPVSRARPWSERPPSLPFPNALPGTSDPSLLSLLPRVRRLIDERRARADYTLRDVDLGARLVAAAKSAAPSRPSDAYLAYVLSAQADRDLERDVHRRIAELRPDVIGDTFLLEHALLRSFYSSGDPYWHLSLVELFVRAELWDKAAYFMDRWAGPPPEAGAAWEQSAASLRAAIAKRRLDALPGPTGFTPVPLPGIESDFEKGTEGWTLTGFQRVEIRDTATGVVRAILTSEGGESMPPRKRGQPTGTAQSAEFVLEGRALGFVATGGGRGLSVELWIDGQAAERAAGPRTRFAFPVFWDIRRHRGRRAFLRVTDASRDTDGYVSVDSFRMWPDP